LGKGVLIAMKTEAASDKLLFELPYDFVLSLVDKCCNQALALKTPGPRVNERYRE